MFIDKVVCIGKNYEDHVREMSPTQTTGNEPPVLFLKPASTILTVPAWNETVSVQWPQNRGELHHECEIVLKLSDRLPKKIDESNAHQCIQSVTVGLDMTLRTLQADLKKKGHPWTTSKVFNHATVVGPWIAVDQFRDYLDVEFSLTLGGRLCQSSTGRKMIYSPERLLIYVQEHFPLCGGDLIFTGTPSGVGAVNVGSEMELRWGQYSYKVHCS